jgi:hypothetical protein
VRWCTDFGMADRRGLTRDSSPQRHFLGGVAHRCGAGGVVGAGARRDTEVRRGGVELEEAAS